MTENIATRDAYGKALIELGKENKDIVVLDADLSKSTKTAGFGKEYPERFFNMGIAEGNMMATAAGFAASGKIAFASTFAIFATGRAFEQVRNSIAYPSLNVKIAATHSGLTVGEDGGSHQAIEDIAIMRAIPNMRVVVPADAIETTKAIKAAVKLEGPIYIRLGRPKVPVITTQETSFELGKGTILHEGHHASIVATGIMVSRALKAAKLLSEQGINVRVINMPWIKPIDSELLIESAKKTGKIVTIEEHNIIGGLGGAVCEVLGEHYPVPIKRLGVKDVFGESGSPDEVLKKHRLTAEALAEDIKGFI